MIPFTIVHDYLLQRGGAERVVEALHFLERKAPIFTFAYRPEETFPSFKDAEIRSLKSTNLVANSKAALAISIPLFSSRVKLPESEFTFFSSSGWSHFIEPTGPSVLYFHSPARWLYSANDLKKDSFIFRTVGRIGSQTLMRLDKKAIKTHNAIIANSLVTQKRIWNAYGIHAPIIHPPLRINPEVQKPLDAVSDRFILHVARSRSYKNHAFVEEIAEHIPGVLFVFVGKPNKSRNLANCLYLDSVSDGELYWLYANAELLLAVAEEDFGLTPLEAANFGTPTLAFAGGGYLETIKNNETGWLIAERDSLTFAKAILNIIRGDTLQESKILQQASLFAPNSFLDRVRRLANE